MLRREFLKASLGAFAANALAPGAIASAQSRETRRILYVLGRFSQSKPKAMQAAVETLGGSGFNVIVLSFLQAQLAAGKLTLLYDGTEFSALAPQLPAMLARLRSGFGGRKRIMLSIGGWQNLPTFQTIRSFGVPAFVRQLTEQAIAPFGLDGIDLDLEPQTGGLEHWREVHVEYGATLAALTNEYKRVHPTHLVTHAPISVIAAEMYVKPAPLAGLQDGLLAATHTPNGNNIDWLNIQFYEGGVVVGESIADYYRERLAGPLARLHARARVAKPIEFLTPLFEPSAKQPLSFCRQTIASIDARCADLHSGRVNGAGLWDYSQIRTSIGDWSAGFASALSAASKEL